MIDSENTPTVDRQLMVFHFPPRRGITLRARIAGQVAGLFDDRQIDGWSPTGDRFTVGQLIDPGFRYPQGSGLFGWLDDNALCQLPAWSEDNSVPPVLTETLSGWLSGAFGSIGYQLDTCATVITVSVPVATAAQGACQCGHDAIEHPDGPCTRPWAGGQLHCGCMAWRAPQAVAR